jgi:hypothetical protein
MPPKRPNPRPPAPSLIMSRRETPQSVKRFLVVMMVASPPLCRTPQNRGRAVERPCQRVVKCLGS